MSALFEVDCSCSCHDPGVCYIPVGDAWFPFAFTFQHICGLAFGGHIHFVNTELGNTWVGNLGYNQGLDPVVVGPVIPVTVICDGVEIEVDATMVASGVGRGEIEIKIMDGATILARWISLAAAQPHCSITMKLVEFDPPCGIQWKPEVCLKPWLPVGGCVGQMCDGDYWGLQVQFPDAEGADGAISWFLAQFPDAPHSTLINCRWGAFRDSFVVVHQAILEQNPDFPLDINAWHFNVDGISVPITVPHGTGYTASWCKNGPYSSTTGSVTVMPVRIPGGRTGFVNPACTPPVGNFCEGAATWSLARVRTSATEYFFYWKAEGNSCDNNCIFGTCTPAIPTEIELPEEPVTQATAEGLGIWDLVGDIYVTSCACGLPYEPPSPTCFGQSFSTLNRTLCEEITGTQHIYWWQQSHTCDGDCEDCGPIPPYELITTPLTEEEAEIEGYLDDLGVPIEGWCECDAPEYVPPECPICDCEALTLNKTFTLSGMTGGEAVFNGTFTLVKTPSDPPLECRWYGDNGDPLWWAELYFNSGTWTLTFGDGDGTTYTLSASTPCGGTLVMSKTGGSAEFPATITVTE